MRRSAINASVILLGLGMTLTLLQLLGRATPPTAAAPALSGAERYTHDLRQAWSDVITVCLSGSCDHTTIQAALDAAHTGDVIKVASGVYTGVSARAGVTQVVYISKSVTIQGGYTTAFTDPPDPNANPTTLDAQGQGRVLYITGDPAASSGQAISPTVEGLRIIGGKAAGLGGYTPDPWTTYDAGGGVYIVTATATIRDNYVFSNTAQVGGGLYLGGSDATLNGNTVSFNFSVLYGGGLALYSSDAMLDGNTVTGNTVGYPGSHDGNGGGLYLSDSGPTLTNNIISDNEANNLGSGLLINGSSPSLLHTTVARNSGGEGSGICVTGYLDPLFQYHASTATLVNTILASHTVGITVTAGDTTTLIATLWGTDTWANDADWGGAGTIVTGTINLWGDPAFVDPDAGDYHIGLGSAAVDAGVDGGVTTDIDGQPRPLGPGFDLGADEYTGIDLSLSRKAVSPEKAGVGEVLTYTIVLFNNGTVSATDTVLFDPIPLSTVYAPGSARTTSGVFVGTSGLTGTLIYTGTLICPDGIRWTGTIMPNEAVTITFQVTVSEDVLIENMAIVTDRYGTSIPLTARANVKQVYLPLVLSRFRTQVPMLGVAMERYDVGSGLEKALELEVHWGRRWRHISWLDVEPNEGEYHWAALAGLGTELLRARASGIEPIIEIQHTPEWAQKIVPYTCGPIRGDKFEAFAGFLEQLVKRYGSSSPYGVRYWQLGNELDVAPGEVGPESVFGCWGDPDDPYYGGEYYGEMLKVVYPRIKAADPQAQVMLGGLLLECDPYVPPVGYECTDERRGLFLEGVMRAGGGDYFDVADVHSYAQLRLDLPARMHSYYGWSGELGGTGLPEKVAFFQRVMGDYGHGDKPVFAGELALKCEEPTEECYDVAAAFVPRAYAEAYGLDLLGGVYYTLISPDEYVNRYKGLLRPDFTPRPAYWACEFMSRQLMSTEYEGPVTDYAGVSGYAFDRSGGRQMQIVWSTDGTDQVIDVPVGFARAYDKYGDALAPVAGQITVGWSPIYVELE